MLAIGAGVRRMTYGARPIFLMTSGLRSVRDKVVTYLEERLSTQLPSSGQLDQVAKALGEQVRRVWQEDATALARSGLAFNLHAILGGQLDADPSPTLFYLYPEGNWIEAAADTPYFVIGRTPYSKPILDRFLSAETTLSTAVKLAYLAFDATRVNVADVDFPLDLLVLNATTQDVTTQRFTADMLATP